MKRFGYFTILAAFLVACSAALYLIHYAVFHDAHHIFIYLVGDIAFLPVEVLIVSLIIDRLLSRREKLAMLEKLNMVIGAFYSEAGTTLLDRLGRLDKSANGAFGALADIFDWTKADFVRNRRLLAQRAAELSPSPADLEALRGYLSGRREFLLRLLENPNLLEHETFTDLLWAVFHLSEELSFRSEFTELPKTDLQHLAGDLTRVYRLLVVEWLSYMEHLKGAYPYLFSLAVRTNPFNAEAKVEVS